MYAGDHVDSRICPVCGDTVTPPSRGGCWICWHDEERGVLHRDEQMGVWVHQSCLNFFGVDDVLQYERRHFDI